jgi:hypothetical protein
MAINWHHLCSQHHQDITMMFPLLLARKRWIRLLLFFLLASCTAFTVTWPTTITSNNAAAHHAAVVLKNGLYYGGGKSLSAKTTSTPDDIDAIINNIKLQLDRREWFQHAGGIALGSTCIISAGSIFLTTGSRHNLAHAATTVDEALLLGSSPDHPIVVLGAGGKTGKLCTLVLAKKRLYCRAVTRSGRQTLEGSSSSSSSPFVSYATADVSDYEAVRAAIKGADGVIFAASASGKNKGGDPAHVDYLGAYNTAKACLEENVRKLVLISAGSTTRPDSAGFVALNVLTKFLIGENIMGYKAAGEQAIRDAYAAAAASSSSNGRQQGYTIIRPGGLSDSDAADASKIHISQGDGKH